MLLVKSKRCQSTVLLVEFSESDVSPLLSQLIKIIPPGYSTCPNLNYLTENSTLLSISNNACNSDSLTMFDLSVFVKLVSVIVGDDNFRYVGTFKIDGLNELKTVSIGDDSFTRWKSDDEWNDLVVNNPTRSFHLLNCNELESIIIGVGSFSDYGGGFELRNLPKLSTIKIGEIGSGSFNFYYSSFVIESVLIVDFNE